MHLMKPRRLVCEAPDLPAAMRELICCWTKEYSFSNIHDVATMIEFMGGKDEFEKRLDYVVSDLA